jgi:hypothetical protein
MPGTQIGLEVIPTSSIFVSMATMETQQLYDLADDVCESQSAIQRPEADHLPRYRDIAPLLAIAFRLPPSHPTFAAHRLGCYVDTQILTQIVRFIYIEQAGRN